MKRKFILTPKSRTQRLRIRLGNSSSEPQRSDERRAGAWQIFHRGIPRDKKYDLLTHPLLSPNREHCWEKRFDEWTQLSLTQSNVRWNIRGLQKNKKIRNTHWWAVGDAPKKGRIKTTPRERKENSRLRLLACIQLPLVHKRRKN